jgi:hypothetical protein
LHAASIAFNYVLAAVSGFRKERFTPTLSPGRSFSSLASWAEQRVWARLPALLGKAKALQGDIQVKALPDWLAAGDMKSEGP